ncbi:hypothetical protein AAIH70_21475 [Neorhizobium sp. BT27B]|uniref:hypothetical protein n=1 Tax=Neorhizobium sp. BT27B TaxID=3142625 RepID=UPI003D27708A
MAFIFHGATFGVSDRIASKSWPAGPPRWSYSFESAFDRQLHDADEVPAFVDNITDQREVRIRHHSACSNYGLDTLSLYLIEIGFGFTILTDQHSFGCGGNASITVDARMTGFIFGDDLVGN